MMTIGGISSLYSTYPSQTIGKTPAVSERTPVENANQIDKQTASRAADVDTVELSSLQIEHAGAVLTPIMGSGASNYTPAYSLAGGNDSGEEEELAAGSGYEAAGEEEVEFAGESGEVGEAESGEEEDAAAAPGETAADGSQLSEEEQLQVTELKARDQEVRQHEQAHMAVGGPYAGAATYTYQSGPDGNRYAIGGEVSIDTSTTGDPEQDIAKMRTVRAAALAPASPSAQDLSVAAAASQKESEARQLANEQRMEELKESSGEETDEGEGVEGTAPAGDGESAGEDAGIGQATGAEAAPAAGGAELLASLDAGSPSVFVAERADGVAAEAEEAAAISTQLRANENTDSVVRSRQVQSAYSRASGMVAGIGVDLVA